MLSIKVASMSAGVLLTALILKLSLPVLVEFLTYELPLLWSMAISWLTLPYLYLVINCIILTIVAFSKLQPRKSEESDGSAVLASQSVLIKAEESAGFVIQSPMKRMFDLNDAVPERSPVIFGYVDGLTEEKVSEVRPVTAEAVVRRSGEEQLTEERADEIEDFVLSRSSWMPPKRDLAEDYVTVDKPLLSQRFSNRKSVKASPEGGKARLGVSKPKRQDALESTWRTITEGRPMPLTRHLKKSDTWIPQGTRGDSSPSGSPAPAMKKAETFNHRSTSNSCSLSPSPGSGRMKRDSPSHDELNRRVEAFIRKFNAEMRLQHRDSLKQYRKMVGRGSR